jgi:hypothetical protein
LKSLKGSKIGNAVSVECQIDHFPDRIIFYQGFDGHYMVVIKLKCSEMGRLQIGEQLYIGDVAIGKIDVCCVCEMNFRDLLVDDGVLPLDASSERILTINREVLTKEC